MHGTASVRKHFLHLTQFWIIRLDGEEGAERDGRSEWYEDPEKEDYVPHPAGGAEEEVRPPPERVLGRVSDGSLLLQFVGRTLFSIDDFVLILVTVLNDGGNFLER